MASIVLGNQSIIDGSTFFRNGMSSTLSRVLWWFGWYTSAGLPVVRVERDFSGTYHTISILHIFLSLVFKIWQFAYFYSPRLLESGGHRKGMANEVRGSKHTDTFWFLYFPCGHQDYHSHRGYLALLASVLYYYMLIFVLRSFCGVFMHLHMFIHYYLTDTGQWQGPVGLFGYCIWIPWKPLWATSFLHWIV